MERLIGEAVDDGKKWLQPLSQNLPQFLVLLGTLILVASTVVLYLQQGVQDGWRVVALEMIRDLSLAVVASGFFSWLMKTLAFKKVLREELTRILYSPDHLKQETPRLQYLENTLVASGLPKQVAKAAAPIFVNRLHSPEHLYYYASLLRRIDLSWHDRVKGIVCVRLKNHYTLHSMDPDRPIQVKGWWNSREKLEGMVPRIDSLRVVPKDQNLPVQVITNQPFAELPAKEGEEASPRVYEWCVTIPPCTACNVDAEFTFYQDVDQDSWLKWEAVVFSEGLELEYTAPADMIVHFTGIGKAEFIKTNGEGKHFCRSLILPGEGYILTMQRKQDEE